MRYRKIRLLWEVICRQGFNRLGLDLGCITAMEGRVMSQGKGADEVRFIGGCQVVFICGLGWRCNCRSWEPTQECRHVLLAAALRTLENAVAAFGGSTRRH